MQNRRVGWVRLGLVGLFNVLINNFMLNSLGDDFGDFTFKGGFNMLIYGFMQNRRVGWVKNA